MYVFWKKYVYVFYDNIYERLSNEYQTVFSKFYIITSPIFNYL